MRTNQVARDRDRNAAHRKVALGTRIFKVTAADSNGAFLVVEIAHHAKGGPPRDVRRHQDRWSTSPQVNTWSRSARTVPAGARGLGVRSAWRPHCQADVSEGPGRITFLFTPAGHAEAFFMKIAKANASCPTDPAFGYHEIGIRWASTKGAMTIAQRSSQGSVQRMPVKARKHGQIYDWAIDRLKCDLAIAPKSHCR